MQDLFDTPQPPREPLGPGALLLRGHALPLAAPLLAAIETVVEASPLRRMMTPGGHTMSVAMTNCGSLGWVSDRRGYRYDPIDPLTGRPWPALPALFLALAADAAAAAGFPDHRPDVCLINCYEPGARLSLHQDRNERGLACPIVSVSLGLPATFQFGGTSRTDRPRNIAVAHGDVVVWGGPSRMAYHGVRPLREGEHPLTGRRRLNLTFRKAR